MDLHLFHNSEEKPEINSMGAILPVVPPLRINVRNKGEWNTFRILMDWPKLTIWTNDEVVQDLDVERTPELRHRFRRGYLGLQSLAYPIRFRNLRVRELPDKEKWQVLYGGAGGSCQMARIGRQAEVRTAWGGAARGRGGQPRHQREVSRLRAAALRAARLAT